MEGAYRRIVVSVAVVLILTTTPSRFGLAQTPAPETPPASSAPALVPPPTVLLPESAPSDAPVSSAAPPKPVEPTKPVRRAAAIIQALDKVTAETLRFEAPIDQPVRYKDLVFIVHVCEDGGPDQRGAAANLEIDSQPKPSPDRAATPSRQVFKGWMFSSAPGLHPLEHPVYDAWLIACKAASPSA